MGSGLIYAVIVAGWAALLAPRWIRRNEEIERAREADAARSVRVLERRGDRVRGGHVSTSARMLGRANFSARSAPAASDAVYDGRDAGPRPTDGHASTPRPHVPTAGPAAPAQDQPMRSARPRAHTRISAAARRRRAFVVLLVTTIAVAAAVAAGLVSVVWMGAPAVLLGASVLLARRAVIRERRRARRARLAAIRREQAAAAAPPAKRVAILEQDAGQPPGTWTPEPVPRPTYLSKAKAEPRGRSIDLATSGAWTSGRLSAAGPGARGARLQRSGADPGYDPDDGIDDHRRAIGD